MQLFPTPDNPLPPDPALARVTAQDGVALRVARWRPTARGDARGTVCILQGRAEFIEKYFETVTDLRQRGFAVVAFDWRGQGGSDRQTRNPRKGHVKTFAHYRRDLEAVRDQVLEPLMPKPHFGLAHSMGGAIALVGAREGWLPFARLVASAPMIALSLVNRPQLAAVSAEILNALGFGQAFVPGGREASFLLQPFAGNPLTGDPKRHARNAAAALAVGAGAVGDPTIGWVNAAFRIMETLAEPRYPLHIRTPTLIVAAGTDPICATPAIERFAARLKAGHAIVLPGARHELLMERDALREEFWAAFDAFIPGTADVQAASTTLPHSEAQAAACAPIAPRRQTASAAVQKGEDRVVEPAITHGDD